MLKIKCSVVELVSNTFDFSSFQFSSKLCEISHYKVMAACAKILIISNLSISRFWMPSYMHPAQRHKTTQTQGVRNTIHRVFMGGIVDLR